MNRSGSTEPAGWDDIRRLIEESSLDDVTAEVRKLDDAARKDIAARLPGYLKELRARSEPWDSAVERHATRLRVVGAGVFGGAAAVASWLCRRDLPPDWNWRVGDTERIMAVLARHPHEWRADLAARLVLGLRTGEDRRVRLALAMLRDTGIDPPRHDPLVDGWARTHASKVAGDPLLGKLLPRLFEAEGVGRALLWDKEPGQGWLGALCALAADGRVRRETLLGGCVRRFLLGGSEMDLRFFVRLHEALAPTPAEIESRTRDYLRLLPTSPGPVAELALGHLRRVPGLDGADLAEAWEALAFRPERKLVRPTLIWIDQALKRAPDLADGAAPALALAFGSDSRELRERAVGVVVKHAGAMGERARDALREAMTGLSRKSALRVAEAFGEALDESFEGQIEEEAEVEAPEAFVPSALPPPPVAQAVPPPIDSPEEMAELLKCRWVDWLEWERLLAGFVSHAYRDREGLGKGLAFALEGEFGDLFREHHWEEIHHWLVGTVRSLTGTAEARGAWQTRLPPPDGVAPMHLFVLHRAAEISMAVEQGCLPPLLLATPTVTTGHLTAAELVTRMEVIEAAGSKPLAADLQQALLRLPRERDADAAERAGRLTSRAGRLIARWLAGSPLPDPEIGVRWAFSRRFAWFFTFEDGEPLKLPRDVEADFTTTIKTVPTGLPLIDSLLVDMPRYSSPKHVDSWPSMLPSHRELAAAHVLPTLGYHGSMPEAEVLDHVLRLDGPAGPATSLILLCRCGRWADIDCLDRVVNMAARGDLPTAEAGRQAALLVERQQLKLPRLVGMLEEAARRGAHHQVWEIMVTALPLLLPGPGERPQHGLSAFVTLLAQVAVWCDAHGAIPEIEAMAARRGSSILLTEARRLHAHLTRVPVAGEPVRTKEG